MRRDRHPPIQPAKPMTPVKLHRAPLRVQPIHPVVPPKGIRNPDRQQILPARLRRRRQVRLKRQLLHNRVAHQLLGSDTPPPADARREHAGRSACPASPPESQSSDTTTTRPDKPRSAAPDRPPHSDTPPAYTAGCRTCPRSAAPPSPAASPESPPRAASRTSHPPVGAFTGSVAMSPGFPGATSSGRKMRSFFHSAFSSTQRCQPSSGIRVPFSGHSCVGTGGAGTATAGKPWIRVAAVAVAAVRPRNERRLSLSSM